MRVGAHRSSAVVVLAKVPQPGRVKTRLVPTVGEDGATALAEAMLGDTLEALEALAPSVARLWVASGSLEAARARVPAHWIVEPQAEGDLGARMGEAWRVAAAERVVIVGADAPSMSAARVEAALTALGTADVVVGPTLDGGYDLLGLRRREALASGGRVKFLPARRNGLSVQKCWRNGDSKRRRSAQTRYGSPHTPILRGAPCRRLRPANGPC